MREGRAARDRSSSEVFSAGAVIVSEHFFRERRHIAAAPAR